MVISLKVKTLDSQTYDFTVDDEISVRQFKETIAEKTSISADLQRLIYCGRVLADEKLLKEYDVNGKVVHVVERPPPSARITSSNTSENSRRSRSDGVDGGIRGSPIFRALDGMVVGAMTIPVNASGEQANVPPLNPSSSFCMNRITVARHMLDCANNIASYLENPERGLNNSSLDILAQGRWTMESTVVEVGISATDNLDLPQNQRQNLVEALHGAVSAALRQNGHPNLTVVQLPTVFGSTGPAAVVSSQGVNQTNDQNSSAGVTDSNAPNDQSQQNTTTITDSNPPENDSTETETPHVTLNNTSQQEQRQGSGEGGTSTSNSSTNSPTRQRTGTRVLSEVINQMTTVQNRLAPFINQYNDILSNDPSFEENDTAGRENAQRIFDRVSEAMHYMSHAQHAISDLMLDLSQPAPRYLCCRPILVEQSGFVSANNIASLFQSTGNNNYNNNNGETNGVNGGGANNGSTTINISTSNDPPVPIFVRSSAPPPPQSAQSTNGSSGTGGGGGGSNNSDSSNQSQSNNSGSNAGGGVNQQQNINRGLHRILSPLLLPMPPTHSSLSSTSVTSNNSTTTDNANSTSSSNTLNQEGQTIAEIVLNLSPRHILIPNPQLQVARLIQAVVNSAPLDADLHVQINAPNLLAFGLPSNQQQQQQTQPTQTSSQQTNASSNTSSTTNTTNNNESAGNQQNQQQQQARVTTATHPTTSTQTRSTPRPQVHVANIPPSQMWNTRVIPANMVSSFDRFLPCSSHHIRDNESHENSQNASNVFVRSRAQMRQRRQQQQQPQQRQPQNQQQANSQQQTSAANRTVTSSSTSRSNNDSNLSNESPIINILGNNVTIRDLMSFTPNPEILNRIRNNIHEFIVSNFFAGSPITEDNMNNAINNVIQLLNDALLFLPQFDLSDYDSRSSVENFIRNSLPFIINLIREDDSNEFGIRLIREMIQFVRRLFVIIVTCVGRTNAELYLNQIMQMAMNSGNIPGEEEALRTLQRQLLPAVLRELDTMLQSTTSQNTSDVQEFLVIRRPNVEQQQQQQSQQRNNQVTPMETDDRENELEQNSSSELPISRIIAAANAAATAAANVAAVAANAAAAAAVNAVANNTTDSTAGAASNESQRQQQQQQQQASLPRVNIGSEPWHNNFPSNWIPIITRDIEKQRRQSPQSPFSDAYISGMSAKRRKMVSNSKPPTDIQSLIKDGVRKAIQTVGNENTTTASSPSSSTSALFNLIGGNNNSNSATSNNDGHTIEEISTAISTDPVAQLSYRETLRTSIHERLQTDSDFTPDKFPNSSKYFTK